jgi:hypothetical protein
MHTTLNVDGAVDMNSTLNVDGDTTILSTTTSNTSSAGALVVAG